MEVYGASSVLEVLFGQSLVFDSELRLDGAIQGNGAYTNQLGISLIGHFPLVEQRFTKISNEFPRLIYNTNSNKIQGEMRFGQKKVKSMGKNQ